MNKKNDPAIQPGDGARAFDTILNDSITEPFGWAISVVRKYQLEGKYEDFNDEFSTLISYFAGCEPDMPLRTAYELVTKLIKERRGWNE